MIIILKKNMTWYDLFCKKKKDHWGCLSAFRWSATCFSRVISGDPANEGNPALITPQIRKQASRQWNLPEFVHGRAGNNPRFFLSFKSNLLANTLSCLTTSLYPNFSSTGLTAPSSLVFCFQTAGHDPLVDPEINLYQGFSALVLLTLGVESFWFGGAWGLLFWVL